MRRSFTTGVLVMLYLIADAQSALRTVIPNRAVVAGASFQVQYVQESGTQAYPVTTPDFRNFKKIAGPYAYSGTDQQGHTVFNTVYTLVALNPGRFIIPGAVVQVGGKTERSNDVVLEVITQEAAEQKARADAGKFQTAYYLAPGEDPHQKIRQNLFVKVTADKSSCYPGEPVVAEFKLYSRLESRSDITRNPGFYGFTVYDMVSLTDQQQSTETVNGKLFAVHTIRKVQLFPQHEGRFIIDAMQIEHTVEFSTVNTSKPTEQQIAEGVLQQNTYDEPVQAGTVTYSQATETEPLIIDVHPLPAGKPAGFSGATGNFEVHAGLAKDRLDLHEEGMLQLIISGKGNFTQFSVPAVNWPAGVEGFEPVIRDSIGKNSVPLSGTRICSYPFIASRSGNFTLPALSFFFFDPVKKAFIELKTAALQIQVSEQEKKTTGGPASVQTETTGGMKRWWWAAGLAALLIGGVTAFLFLRHKRAEPKAVPLSEPLARPAADPLQPAREAVSEPHTVFCQILYQSIWAACTDMLALHEPLRNKAMLRNFLIQKKVKDGTVNRLMGIMENCEALIYAGADMQDTSAAMLAEAEQILEEIRLVLL